ncbi:MAG: hypothetical protein ACR2I0_13105 [Rhodoferax sp.]
MQKSPAPTPAPPDAVDRYVPGDPIPAAEVTEADTESVWALFAENPEPAEAAEPEFAPTQIPPL